MNHHRLLLAFMLAGVVFLPRGASADESAATRAGIDAIIQPLIDEKKNVGVAVGYLRGEESAAMGYGLTSLEGGVAPDADTVYEIGSITKVFTAILLADMADDGMVELDAPVQRYLPRGVLLNVYKPKGGGEEKEITLLQLTVQISGLYRMPNNFRPGDINNPFADYSVEMLYEFLENAPFRAEPGTDYMYSNVGVGLLGHALALAAGEPYEQLVIDRICDPLGMNDTRITLSPELKGRLAPGYSKYGEPAANWDLDALAGAGAIRSTVNDMMRFISFNIGLEETELRAAMDATHESRFKISDAMSIGMGWHAMHNDELSEPIIWHNGGTGGYRTFTGFLKEAKVGVVVLSNTSSSVDEAGVNILRLLAQ